MRYIKFQVLTDHEYTGEAGIIANIHQMWENYIPTQPFGLGHDLLDHASNERGHFYQELEALGGAAFRTNFGNHIPTLVTPYPQVTSWEFISSLRDSAALRDAPKYKLTKDETAELDIFLKAVRPFAIDGWESEFAFDDYDDMTNFFSDDQNWQRVCDWFKYGFARAKRRFKGDAWSMYIMRERIEKVVQQSWAELMQWVDSGREFTLALDYENTGVEVRGLPW